MSAVAAQSLYSREVLRLAMALPHHEQLENPQGSASSRSPLCGSMMSVDVVLAEGAIRQLAIRARACALGQATAAVVRHKAIGMDAAAIVAARKAIANVLASETGDPIWPELEPLAYARDFPARHGAILLPFDALLAAIENAQS
jgi:NifU-like protein involved in Fe-S cluster formation